MLFFIAVIFFYLIPIFEKHLIKSRQNIVRGLVQSAWSIIDSYYAQEVAGVLTRQEAQRRALARVRSMRYGPGMKDYFWVNDMVPRMIMHPYRGDLEGTNLKDFTDPDGNPLFVTAVQIAREHHEGFLSYKWQHHDNPNKIEPKVSYVKHFAPWDWIIGSGIYVNDVVAEIKRITFQISIVAVGVLSCIAGIYVFILLQGIRSERARAAAERAITQSEERFRSLAENIAIGVFRISAEAQGSIIYANQALLDIYGAASREEIRSVRLVDIYAHPADRTELLSELFQNGKTQAREILLKNKKGEPVWCSVNARLVRNENGSPAWIDGTLEDISKRKLAEIVLQESEQRWKQIIEFLPDATFAIDLQGKVIAWNKAMEKLTNIPAADIIGHSHEQIARSFYGEQRPLLIDLLFSDHKEIEQRYAWVKRFKDHIIAEGALPYAYGGKGAYAWAIAGYLYDHEGRVSGAIESIRDITDRHNTEEELRRSREHLDMVISGAELGTWEWDIKTGALVINKRWGEILGYGSEPVVQHVKEWEEMLHPEDAPQVLEALNAHLQGITSYYQSEHRLKTKGGDWRWVLDCGRVMEHDAKGSPLRAAGIILDIHERKIASENLRVAYEELRARDEQLMQADKMTSLGTLVAGVAHEINNPNNFIMLNTPLIQNIWNDVLPVLDRYCAEHGDFKVSGMLFSKVRTSVPALISGILDGTRRINNIIKELRDFARPEEAGMDQSVAINGVVKASIELLHHEIQKATRSFSVSYGENLPPVTGNAQRLEQVVVNLILNACHALPEPSRGIYIQTRADAQRVLITVQDEGVGIPEEHLGRIMDPFFTTKRSSGGTGLGLAISYKIVQQHQGRIDVQSVPGKGSVFTVILPVHPGAARHRILVADDEAIMRDIICKVLACSPAW